MSDKQEIAYSHTLTEYPKELQKKVTLLQHFRSYLEGDSNNAGAGGLATSSEIKTFDKFANVNIEDPKIGSDDSLKKINNYVYVKKWMRTRHAIMFRLSNRIVQVCFQDHTEIILSSESRIVTYVNKKAERLTYPLGSALESNNTEMTKRLKYTKDILTHMLTLNQGTAGNGTGSALNKDKQIDPTADEK
jgi:polo-like kinase 1